jgi:acetyl esterase/lipase
MARARLLLDFIARGRPFRYGPHRSQCADLHLPRVPGPHPVMVLVHGGSWQRRYGKIVMRGLAGDLARRGWAVWNIEYRRVGEGGGWPATFEDVAAAIDHLAEVDMSLDLDRVNVLGHSAGGQLALWAAGRERLPQGAPGARPALRIEGAIGMAAVCDLAGAYGLWRGGAVRALMGGGPEHRPERYAIADPMRQAPLDLPVLLVHGVRDRTVSIDLARRYAGRAARGGACELVEIEGDPGAHRAHLDPRGEPWAAVTRRLNFAAPAAYAR